MGRMKVEDGEGATPSCLFLGPPLHFCLEMALWRQHCHPVTMLADVSGHPLPEMKHKRKYSRKDSPEGSGGSSTR